MTTGTIFAGLGKVKQHSNQPRNSVDVLVYIPIAICTSPFFAFLVYLLPGTRFVSFFLSAHLDCYDSMYGMCTYAVWHCVIYSAYCIAMYQVLQCACIVVSRLSLACLSMIKEATRTLSVLDVDG